MRNPLSSCPLAAFQPGGAPQSKDANRLAIAIRSIQRTTIAKLRETGLRAAIFLCEVTAVRLLEAFTGSASKPTNVSMRGLLLQSMMESHARCRAERRAPRQQHRCCQDLSRKPIPLRGTYRPDTCCRARQESSWTTAIDISWPKPAFVQIARTVDYASGVMVGASEAPEYLNAETS